MSRATSVGMKARPVPSANIVSRMTMVSRGSEFQLADQLVLRESLQIRDIVFCS